MEMQKEDRERLVRVEMGVLALTEAVKEHIKADCDMLGCKLHDDVESLKQTQKSARRVSWSGILVGLGLVLRYIWKGVITNV